MNWKPIEAAPKDGTEIVGIIMTDAYVGLPHFVVWRTYRTGLRRGIFGWQKRNNHAYHPTHWSPLPRT